MLMRGLATFAIAALAACGGAGSSGPDAAEGRFCENQHDLPVGLPLAYDLLFVVDRSPSMAEERATWAVNARRFANVLENVEGGLPSVHVAVVSADAADGARFHGRDGACAGLDGTFLIDRRRFDGSRERNYQGSFADALACLAALEPGGGEITEPLAAMAMALDPAHPDGAGFARPGAFLGVVFVTDEDDCSAPAEPADRFACTEQGVSCDGGLVGREPASYAACEPRRGGAVDHPEGYVDLLRAQRADPSQIIVAGVVGPPAPFAVGAGPALEPSCELAGVAGAAPAVRLGWFLDQFPNRNTHTTLCDDDWSDALTLFAELLRVVLGYPCLDGAIDATDLDPAAPGLQIECAVADVRFPGTSMEEGTTLARCALGDDGVPREDTVLPCWWVERDVEGCADTPSQLVLHVERADFPATGTHVIARCAAHC